jgi:hypothetical protein
MSDFFRELEEEIREERLTILWRKYGHYIIGLALAIVIGTASYSLWTYVRHKNRVQAHISFSRAVDLVTEGKKEEALQAFQVLAQAGGGCGKLAQLYEASLVLQPEALYTKISQENAKDPGLGNLPKLLKAARALGKPEAMAALEPLTAPHNAWAPLSLELLALASLQEGDEAKAARDYLRALQESSTPSEQVRIKMMLSQIDVPAYLLQENVKEETQP